MTGLVGDNVNKRLKKSKLEGNVSFCMPEVMNMSYWMMESYMINQDINTCTYIEWQISGIPYKHATLGITHGRANFEEYCDGAFSNGA